MKVKILTEGGNGIGLGHISRCVSLYDEVLSRGIDAEFIVYGDIEGTEILKDKNILNANWLNIEYLRENITKEDYVIVDSYKADKEIYNIIAQISKKSLYIDDFGRLDYPKGIILNPSLDSRHINYSNTSKNILLVGPKYVIIRSSFIGIERKHIQKEVKRVLVVMGGTDVRNIIPLIIDKICKENQDIFFDIVLGNLHCKSENININLENINFHVNVSEKEMSQIMVNCDMAITAAGQTIYELLATKTPFIAVQVVDNQANNIMSIKEYLSSEIVLKYDDYNFVQKLQKAFEDLKSVELRKTLVEKMNNLIDGMGRKRIINALLDSTNVLEEQHIFLRKVKEEDIRSVFELSNQDYVRRYSINKNMIQWSEHIKWFESTINDKNVVFYVVTNKNEEFLGQIRFKIDNQNATVSISLSEKLRGKGLSKVILHQSIEKLFEERKFVEEVIAFVSEDNIASKKLFEGLDFRKVGIENNMIKFILKRGDFYNNRTF